MTFNWSSILLVVSASALFTTISGQECTDEKLYKGPLILPCLKEIVLQKGNNFTLTCKGKNPIKFTHQESPEEIIGNFNSTQRSEIIEDGEYEYKIDLDLFNVDEHAIGYYACFENTTNLDLNDLTEEPENTEYASYIYIYVNGTGRLFAPMREIVVPKSNKVVIECRPTTPDVEVTLAATSGIAEYAPKWFSPKVGFVLDIDVLDDSNGLNFFSCDTKDRMEEKLVYVKQLKKPPKPTISRGTEPFLKGETFTLNCTVQYELNDLVNLSWIYPPGADSSFITEKTNTYDTPSGILYRNITITNANKSHAGKYFCVSSNNCGEEKVGTTKQYLDAPILKLTKTTNKKILETRQKVMKIAIGIESYPKANFYFLKNNEPIPENNKKYEVKFTEFGQEAELKILNTTVTDTANYTLFANNSYLNASATLDVRIRANATILEFKDKKCVLGMKSSLACKVSGYRLPNVTWSFDGQEMPSTYVDVQSLYNLTAYLEISRCINSGNITCSAQNEIGPGVYTSASKTSRLLVYELVQGFGIDNVDKTVWYAQDEDISIRCLASKYDYSNVTWDVLNDNVPYKVEYSTNQFSLISTLKINAITMDHSGIYECHAYKTNDSLNPAVTDDIEINVEARMLPNIKEPSTNKDEYAFPLQPVQLHCQAEGVPLPQIQWYKDGDILINNTDAVVINRYVNRTTINSTVVIYKMKKDNEGLYECVASNILSDQKKTFALLMKGEISIGKYLGPIVVIVVALMGLVAYLMWKVKKEKKLRKELAAAGLLYFNEGVTKSLNPELGIDEQAELLPYDQRFEFPPEKLKLGKQLGAGAFGVVYKAEARGIVNAEETTPVAVKMVKKTADNMYIKALASELKIMVHLGKHINIVNLLGACTKNVGKRELAVIVEYCKFGNIHNYIIRHREVFIDQLTDNNKEKNLGKINQGFSYTGSTGMQSDYFGCTNTQETDHTFVNSANTNRSGRKNMTNNQQAEAKASEGYVQPEWRSNYESDYSYDGRTPRPLSSRDLLAWAFQIARGMEYLASRKVLHGDLAARNVLLAEDNIVKICDFGLARSIYKNDEYQKKENSPLPVKWLAIECMTDRIFSTQSDVWSFGIVLWELFSLAKTPYPNISPANLVEFLSEGHRLPKPAYADDRIYEVMKRCWEHKPTARPSFTELQEILGTFLEDNVRNHYVDLNSSYMDKNAKAPGQEDYLAMVSAPDYNNMVTPSPHHYVNDARSFFPPTPTKVDDEGYLQMSPASNPNIFSPRPASTKFDFDPRKFNARPSEANSAGSELTPMLTLNNLPRSGSESDHEGNASPYLNMCPKIEEETDEVFDDTRQNNVKNHATNLMYITLDKDMEKIPNNNYVNIKTPSSLVK